MPQRLSDFIKERKADILRAWERSISSLPKAAALGRPSLFDHVPDLLERIAEIADVLVEGGEPRLPRDLAEKHALERLDEGFDLAQVVVEFAVLRECIVRLWADEAPASTVDSAGLRALNQAVDRAVAASVDRYTQARDRTLKSLDRISAAAFEARSLDDFLQRLLRVLLETTAAVDTATILLREGDRLVVRACVGLGPDVTPGFSLPIGDGFAGTIAARKQPLAMRAGEIDPPILRPSLRAKGVTSIYGIPLLDGDEVIGVAHMGSLTAPEFSDQDRRLLSALAARATTAIFHHLLRQTAERRAEELAVALEQRKQFETIVERHPDCMYLLDPELRFIYANPALLALVGKGRDEVVGKTLAEIQHAPHLVDLHRREMKQVLAGKTVIGENADHLPSGEERCVEYILVPVTAPDGAVRAIAGTNRDVTERKRVEHERAELLAAEKAARREAERALAVVDALLSSSLIGFGFVDKNLRYVRINDALAAINGPPVAEHLGRTVRDVLGAQADRIEPLLHRVIDTGEPIANIEFTVAAPATPDRARSFLGNYFPVRTANGEVLGVGAAVVEITARARAAEALRASEERLKRALSIDTVGVLFFRLDGTILGANQALERMSGYTLGELSAMDGFALTPPEFTSATRAAVERLATTGEAPAYEKQWVRPDGSRWWGLFAPTRLSGSGRDAECVEFIVDVSERKRAEQALTEAMRAREELLAVVSHDLKNPLGAIYAAASLLSRTAPARSALKQIEAIRRSAERMDRLIGDLLDMASIQAGHLAVERKPEPLGGLVNEAIEMHESAAKQKGVVLARADEVDGSHRILCDRDRILQVFGNLLGNAIKFCRAGDVITVRTAIAGSEARFSVTDTGPGIASSELPHVFEPYWSAERHAKQGTGLGLYIAKGIVEAHGGHVRVESRVGEGTTFSFTCPLAAGSK